MDCRECLKKKSVSGIGGIEGHGPASASIRTLNYFLNIFLGAYITLICSTTEEQTGGRRGDTQQSAPGWDGTRATAECFMGQTLNYMSPKSFMRQKD